MSAAVRTCGLLWVLFGGVAAAHPAPRWAPPTCDGSRGAGASAVAAARQCCWSGQWWSAEHNRCLGAPACPAGFLALGERCAPVCPDGHQITEETAGHCCWPGQVWSQQGARCVGAPVCPPGLGALDEECVPGCPAGQVTSQDTGGHCCWPAQVWSPRRQACVGAPSCPAGLASRAESCVVAARAAFAAPPPPPRSPPAEIAPPPLLAPPAVAPPARAAAPPRPPEAVAPSGSLRVRIVAARSTDSYLVEYGGAKPCLTPCSLDVSPGRLRLRVFGDGRFSTDFPLLRPSMVRVSTRRGGYFAAGGVLIAGGVAAASAGAALYLTHQQPLVRDVTIGLGILSAVFIGTGLPLALAAGSDGARVEALPTRRPVTARLDSLSFMPLADGAWAAAKLAF